MDSFAVLQDLAAVLGAAIVMGWLFFRLKQPVIIGYLIGGVLVGPFGLQFVADAHLIETFAEIGVVLLMFALGLELSFSELKPVKAVAGFGGVLQIVITVAVGALLANLLKLSLGAGILLGCIVALSSTVIVLKVLMERGELDSMHGRIALGLLIVQDLSVVPMMVMMPNLANPADIVGMPMVYAIGKAAAVLLVVGWLGMRFFPLIMRRVAATRNKELLMLAAIAACFGTAALTYTVGLSLALGAFLAGIVIGESDHSHQILADILPLRDLFATLFFVSVGMLINPMFIVEHIGAVAALVAAIVIGKAVLMVGITRAFGFSGRTSFAVGMGLAQIGEFSIVLAKMGRQSGVFSEELLSLVLASTLLSIVLTPLMMSASFPLYRVVSRALGRKPLLTRPESGRATGPLHGLVDHVVICGFGRVGSHLGEVLLHHKIPMLVIDLDQHVLQSLRARGVPCLYGDSSNLEVLRHASLPLARALILTLPDHLSCRLALEHAKQLNPDLPVMARAHRTKDVATLYAQGADQVIQPEFEASLEAIRYTLGRLGYSSREIFRYCSEIRQARYHQFLDDFQPDAVPNLLEALGEYDLQWVEVPDGAPVAGLSLKEAAVRNQSGAAVMAIRHDGAVVPNPGPDAVIKAGDAILVMGDSRQLAALTAMLRPVPA